MQHHSIVTKKIPETFFDRPVLEAAPDLLGKFLVRKVPSGKTISGMIIEVEAYDGPQDLACHASRGKTPRTAPMFDRAGVIYIYFVYGMHWMLNIVTGPKDYPAAILIRGIEINGEPACASPYADRRLHGPAKITKLMKIDKALNHQVLGRKTGLWIEDRGVHIKKKDIERTPRIGVAYAKEWAEKPYRFLLHENNK